MKRKLVAGITAVVLAHVPGVSARSHRGCPRTVSSHSNMSAAAVKAEIRNVFGGAAGTAIAIARRESHYHTGAVNLNCNGTRDYGVFQLNSGGTLQSLGLSSVSALDGRRNVRAAYRLYKRRGWQPWAASSGT